MRETNVTFDVIIPLYNSEQTILTTLESVKRQSFQPCHIIVINDGSTDRGPNLVRMEVSEFNQVVLLDTENKGRSAARNLGISHADSHYVAFLDADDQWELDRLELARHTILRTGAKAYASGYKVIKNGNVYHGRRNRPRAKISLQNLVTQVAFIPGSASSAIISRDLLLNSNLFPTSRALGEDLYAWCEIASKTDWVLDPVESVIIKQRSFESYSPPISAFSAHIATLDSYPELKRRIPGLNSLLYLKWVDLRTQIFSALKRNFLKEILPEFRNILRHPSIITRYLENFGILLFGPLLYLAYALRYGLVIRERKFRNVPK
jgi:glycosyltransferase involved in cell wall biosynthesis